MASIVLFPFSMRKSHENDSAATKAHTRNDEKININIFLANNMPELEFGSDSECVGKQISQPKSVFILRISLNLFKNSQFFLYFLQIIQKSAHDQTICNKNDSKSTTNSKYTAEIRRNLFRQKSASLNEVRSHLTRAMSAPIRQNSSTESQDKKQVNANPNSQMSKRRLRRKKIAPIEIDSFNLKIGRHQQSSYQHKLMTEKSFDDYSSARVFTSLKPPKQITKPITQRARSAVNGSDIVTLVSLLSPGASDSEKEDFLAYNNDSSGEKQKPSLRKVGKSGRKIYLFTIIYTGWNCNSNCCT